MSKVDHPNHYQHPSGVEAIQVCEWENFNVGNALKYLFRAGRKEGEPSVDDLQKASWYLQREIVRRLAMTGTQAERDQQELERVRRRLVDYCLAENEVPEAVE
jgi:hypothetical protein